uniref:BTB domain-containing protein n=1 Tax=Lygus hesperus TaxID=30085 RepID=A0A0K8TCV8_LYGHE
MEEIPDDTENCSLSLCYNGQAVVETKYQLYLNNKFNRYTHGGLTSDVFPGDESRCWGYDHFISREVVLDKAKGYLFGDKVKIGVRIQSDPIRMSNVEEYSGVLIKSLNRQRVLGKYADLILDSSRGVWQAHKVIVSSQSAVIDEKLSNVTDKYPIRVVISDEYCADVGSVLQFVYTGSVNNSSESVKDLVNCAHNLKIDSLKSFCEDELLNNVTCENLIDRFILSHRYQLPTLKAVLMNYVSHTKCSTIRYDIKEKLKNFPDLLLEITSFLLNN